MKTKISLTAIAVAILFVFNSVNAQQIAGGSAHSLKVCNDGTVCAWGLNGDSSDVQPPGYGNGQLGDGTTTNHPSPIQVNGLTGIIAVSCGYEQSTALKSDGTVWAWGKNDRGQLGDGTLIDRLTPVQVQGLNNVIAIASGGVHTLALKNDGTVWGWGNFGNGQLGIGIPSFTPCACSKVPVQVQNLSGVIAVAAGIQHSLALKNDGTVWAFGFNQYGEIGNGSNTLSIFNAVQVTGLTNITAIACGAFHSLAIKNDGTVWAWGLNDLYQLADGTTTNRNVPVQMNGISNAIAASGGYWLSLVLKNDGTVWGIGANFHGEVGNGNITPVTTFTQVIGVNNIIGIASGVEHCLAVKNDGSVWTWGDNQSGQLGDGTLIDRNIAVQITSDIWHADLDGDGFGNPNDTIHACIQPSGYVIDGSDCNDNDISTHSLVQYFIDADQDGYGSTATAMVCSSTAPPGYSTNNTDCDDNNAAIHSPVQYYIDADHDGYGSNATATVCSLTPPTGYSTNNTDCNDNDDSVHSLVQYYIDADHDGFGSNYTAMLCSSTAPTGYSTNNTDCNDNNASVHPEGSEICGNGIDDNCNGQIDEGCCFISVYAGIDETLYFGYAQDQCVSKTASVSNGTPPYTYSWTLDRPLLTDVVTPSGDETMTGTNSQTVTVCLMDTATLCVMVTDAHNCTTSDCVTIFADDVRCFTGNNNNNDKVVMCHTNNNNSSSICVNVTSVSNHLAQGDYLGHCVSQRLANEGDESSSFMVVPNPSSGIFDLQMTGGNYTSVEIYDVIGNLVFKKQNTTSASRLQIDLTNEREGVYFISVRDDKNNLITKKIVKM